MWLLCQTVGWTSRGKVTSRQNKKSTLSSWCATTRVPTRPSKRPPRAPSSRTCTPEPDTRSRCLPSATTWTASLTSPSRLSTPTRPGIWPSSKSKTTKSPSTGKGQETHCSAGTLSGKILKIFICVLHNSYGFNIQNMFLKTTDFGSSSENFTDRHCFPKKRCNLNKVRKQDCQIKEMKTKTGQVFYDCKMLNFSRSTKALFYNDTCSMLTIISYWHQAYRFAHCEKNSSR